MPVRDPIPREQETPINAMLRLQIMRERESFRKAFLATLAILLGAVAIAYGSIWMYEGLARSFALQVMGLFPIPFLLVAFAVLFLRLEELNAWLLAFLFCAFIGAPALLNPSAISPSLRAFAFAFRAVFSGMLCPLFYLFFAVFPLHSP